MATSILESAFTSGEVSPALFGNTQLTRMHSAAATMRNFFAGYQGGAYSRAGTAFVGFSKQTGRNFPPRLIPFQFSINQGLALEFGNFYMRVIFDGAFVTETPASILNISHTNPVQLTLGQNAFAINVAPVNTTVSASYAPLDNVSLLGSVSPVVIQVLQTSIVSLALNNAGSGYGPNDVINLAGGSFVVPAEVSVLTTKILSATIASPGAVLTNGTFNTNGTTGVGTKFQLNVTVAGGIVTTINSIVSRGSYSVNPSNLAAEPLDLVPGGGGSPATVTIVMEINTITISSPGLYTVNPPGAAFTQGSTSGSGVGATFNTVVMGPGLISILSPGQYAAIPSNPVGQASTTGTGVGAQFNVTWSTPPTLNTGDWLFISGTGIGQLDNQTFVATVAGSVAALFDVYGNPVDGTGFSISSGGTASRIFTLPAPYSEADLAWIKITQTSDVMSLCCVNQDTGTEYPAIDLTRFSDTSWTFAIINTSPTVSPPSSVAISATGSGSTEYEYEITSVSPIDGTESIASAPAQLFNAVDIAATAGAVTLQWSAVPNVVQYNIYKASPGLNGAVIPPGSTFGFAGFSIGTSFIDDNIIPDQTQVPPTHRNPFARGQVTAVNPNNGGSGYTVASVVIGTLTGSGASIEAIIRSGSVIAYIVHDGGIGYRSSDTITIAGNGSGATASMVIGPQSGTYPGCPAYFQERRAYAFTLNQPDTYFMSQPGSFTNFDTRTPTIDTDAITGSPWSVQTNGIQFMIPIGGALMTMTGLEAFLLTGNGGSTFTPQPLTPASQSAQNQGFNGCSATIPPIRIYQDVLYVQAKGSTYRDFTFSVQNYSYVADDITQNSNHLFNNYTVVQHAWCEEPYRVLWSIRSDGIMLSLTWLKSEKIGGWTRHDTFGSFKTCCAVTEPPVDALYVGTQRILGSHTAYIIERMNNRLWNNVEDTWCVDCGFQTSPTLPAATLSANSATGIGAISGTTALVGGTGYSASTTATVVDDNGNGPGAGAVLSVTVIGGIITAIVPSVQGAGYVNPSIVISDPAGSAGGLGASAKAVLDNSATFTSSAVAFSPGSVGQVIRMGGGVATVTSYIDGEHVIANISTPISSTYPDATGARQVIPQVSGTWSIASQITTVQGLGPMIGATVTGLADGVKIPPQVVSAQGTITLAQPASKITVGLPFQAQLQSVYVDTGEPTSQGQRKDIPEVTARIMASGPFKMGSNQVDGSTLSPPQVAPAWSNLQAAPVSTVAPYNSVTVPLCTDDIRIPVGTGTAKHGQVCVQQDDPYPLNVLAFVPAVLLGDVSSQNWPEKQKK